ncbi:uncharacterized protein LOC114363196 [Ostrinia furnacalis]|uniref:uncharacterized protein LOC114363196 n=1 Tax=Ostrinia furnacalis TaxID=93504 RepID=UPI001039FCC8|nr:uncharacterized protein LOC114363196 [Ostrinia furnacalis]
MDAFNFTALLRRTLLDYRGKLQSSHIEHIKQIINDAENIVSHYIYLNAFYDWTDLEFRVSKLFQDDTILVNSISEFNRNRLNPWVLSNEFMNEHIKEIDEGTLPKEKFVEFVQAMSEYFISLEDSETIFTDNCMSQVAFNREPYDFTSTQQCLVDDFCEHRILSPPSVAYSLSHRLLNIFFRLKIRKCYIKSEEADLREIDKLCAFMYREAVYLARRGFFVRDLFLEHIALCAMMGYEEFHRKHWFTKALSWVNEEGCMKEFRNFEINRTRIMRNKNRFNYQDKSTFLKWRCNVLHSLCDDHPSALLMVVLSHAIRHTVHFMLT